MRKLNILLFFAFVLMATAYAQTKQVTVEEIYEGAFRTEGLDALNSMKNGKQYTVLNIG